MNRLGEFQRPALIRGHGHARICFVSTSKNGITANSGWHIFSPPIAILDSDDDFEDGIYELVLGAQMFVLIKDRGGYHVTNESVAADSEITGRAA